MNKNLGNGARILATCFVVGCGSFGDSKNQHGDGATIPIPAPTTMTPALGPTLGGQLIALQGQGFSAGATLLFGGAPATQINVASPSVVTALTPPHDAGRVPVQIVSASGVAVDVPGGYEYVRGFDTAGRPRVVSAVSTSNTTVRVTFSEPVAEGSDVPSNFRVTHANVNPESGTLPVIGAAPGNDGSSVELTTASQNEVIYELAASNIRDLDGNLLAPPELLVNPAVVQFAGTPPVAGVSLVDTDGDGLSDNAELLGWTVTVWLSNGDMVTSTHTSDPALPDTDGDGLGDADELLAGSNPRQADTDGDMVSDVDEWNVWWSDPTKQDTDDEGLSDGIDIAFGLSPTLDDTDGDGYDDYQERFALNRNPLIADLPRPQVVVTGYDLALDVVSSYTDETGAVRSIESLSSSSVSQAQASSTSRNDTRSTQQENRFSQNLGVEAGYSTKDGFSGKISASVGFEQSRANGYSSSVTTEDAVQSQQTYDRAVAEALQTSEARSVTRTVQGANISATVNIGNPSDVPFTIQNLELSVLRQDRKQGGVYRPVGTLQPSGGAKLEMNLAPNDLERGPIIFQNTDIFPNLVDELLREPTGLVFKVANFDVVDEEGRNFAYSYATVNSRTAGITIDYGDGTLRSYRVATHGPFDANGAAQGIPIAQGLQILGFVLTQNDAELPDPIPSPLPPALQFSVGTLQDSAGVERLVRVGGVQNAFAVNDPEKRFWTVQTNNELLSADTPFSQIRLKAGQEYLLMYTRDIDRDGLFEREESAYGSSDNLADSDTDGLDDFAEVRGGWTVRPTPGIPYRVFSSPSRKDSDLDGVDDQSERRFATDPNRADTDQDGVIDSAELTGEMTLALYDGDDDETNDVSIELVAYSDHVVRDGGDGIANTLATGDDVQVVAVGAAVAPGDVVITAGPNGVLDTEAATADDVRGLLPAIAPGADGTCNTTASGDDIQVVPVGSPLAAGERCVHAGANGALDSTAQGDDFARALHEVLCVLAPSTQDTDFDGIPDGRELVLGTNPNANDAGTVTDSDRDGLYDSEEDRGWNVTVAGVTVHVTSDPARSDTDNDGVPDAIEFGATSNPRLRDTDGDGLADSRELDASDADRYYDEARLAFAKARCVAAQACNVPSGQGTRSSLIAADSDNDGRADKEEVETSWVVAVLTPNGTPPARQVFSAPYSADADLDGLDDVGEKARGTDPNLADSDLDGAQDGAELLVAIFNGTTRNPARADRAVGVRLPSGLQVAGDCDPGTGGGDFYGPFKLRWPGQIEFTEIYNASACDQVDEGNSCQANGTTHEFILEAGQTFAYSSDIHENDGDNNSPNMQDLNEVFDYERLKQGLPTRHELRSEGGDADCQINVDVSIVVR